MGLKAVFKVTFLFSPFVRTGGGGEVFGQVNCNPIFRADNIFLLLRNMFLLLTRVFCETFPETSLSFVN